MLLTEKYAKDLHGVLSCYDRVIIHGNIAGWCFAEGMTAILASRGVRVFDFAEFSAPLTEAIRKNAEQIAQANDVKIEFIRAANSLGWYTFFQPWKAVTRIGRGMTRQQARRS